MCTEADQSILSRSNRLASLHRWLTVSIGGNNDSALVLVLCVSKSPSHFFVLYCGLTVWIRRRMAWFSRLILSISFCLLMKFKLKQYDYKVLYRTMMIYLKGPKYQNYVYLFFGLQSKLRWSTRPVVCMIWFIRVRSSVLWRWIVVCLSSSSFKNYLSSIEINIISIHVPSGYYE